jgi:MoxR-like ATPase
MSATLHESAKQAFDKRFVNYEEPLEALVTGYSEFEPDSGEGANIIFHGPGGFGKSEMAKTFAQVISQEPFVQSFGASSSEEAIWGELDLKELRDGDAIRFHLERSFLAYHFVILEEALDLPGRILDDLKDTLSARCFRRGNVQFPMKTRCVVICTNHDPAEYRKRSASAEALIQRFPIEVRVRWADHDARTYRQMYEKQLPAYSDLAPLFALIVEGLCNSEGIVSPREALNLLRTVVRRARAHGRETIVASDFNVLLHATRFGREKDVLTGLIRDALDSCGTHIKLNGYRHQASALIHKLKALAEKDLDGFVGISGDLERVRDKVHALLIPAEDGGFEAKQNLLRLISQALKTSE